MCEEKRSVPNIVFILADDLGYGELGCYGQKKIKTPNIDRMAAEGMRFTNFYCGCTVCAPSRCTLMTGKHLGHATVRDNMQRQPGLEGQHPMEPGTVTVAQLLKKAGYATAIIGKWGLGMPQDHSSPLDFGFDHHYGYLCQGMAHTYYPPYLWRDDKQEPLAGNPAYSYGQRGVIEPSGKTYSHDLMAAGCAGLGARAQGRAVLPLSRLHHPARLAPGARGLLGRIPRQVAGDADDHLEALCEPRHAAGRLRRNDHAHGPRRGPPHGSNSRNCGLDDRTLVFFASDNGAVFPLAGTDPEFFHSNGELRGYKQDLYEGGIRTPLIARWPGRIKAGATSDLIGAFWDVMPTLCEIAGTPAPDGIDGFSIAPTLLGHTGQKLHEYLYWEYHSEGRAQAVRFGDWKAVRNNVKKAPDATPELYNLASDPSEKTNLAVSVPTLPRKPPPT